MAIIQERTAMTDTTAPEKLEVFSLAWRDADTNFSDDMFAAITDAQRNAVIANKYRHKSNWIECGIAALDKNSAAIAALMTDAEGLTASIKDKRERAQAIAGILRDSGRLAASLEGLLKEVAKI
jgi:hypothetical protein